MSAYPIPQGQILFDHNIRAHSGTKSEPFRVPMVRVLALQGDLILRQSAVVMLGNLRPSEVLEFKSGDSEFQERLRSKPRLS